TTIAHVLGNPFYCGIMQYHKQYTPDYLEQKKVDNYGEIEFVYVQGTHEPIVSIDEFRRVQWILDQRREERRSMDGSKTVKMKGKSIPQTVWGRLLICHCGLRFHRTSYHRKLPAYICYNVSKFGSIAQRKKKGLTVEEACDSPYLPQWRLEMIAQRIFKEYICDADRIVDLAMEMIKKHMAAADEKMNALQQKLNQYIKEEKAIGKKLDVFISMRTEGEITKVEFYERTKDLQERMTLLEYEIKRITDELQTLKNVDYAERLAYLRRKLNSYVDFSESIVISDSVVEAFIKKIVVFCDHQDWYLRTEDDIWSLFGGKSFAPDQFFYEKQREEPNTGIWVAAFTVTYDDAKRYVKQVDPKRCVKKWNEIKVNLYI
ncbi:MAG: recombinase family protein, partial [Clostridia bacterium]|nr:recombinase family protein [Clostridia bacterium]